MTTHIDAGRNASGPIDLMTSSLLSEARAQRMGSVSAPSQPRDPVYMLERGEREAHRLTVQAAVYERATLHILQQAGIGPGRRVLDIGSGAGDVALLAARLVGPSGSVVGIDVDAAILNTARRRGQRGRRQCRVHRGGHA